MHLRPRLHRRDDEPLALEPRPDQRIAARERMADGHRNMDTLAPELLNVAIGDRRIASEEGDVDLPRPDRLQVLPPSAVLKDELDVWKATAIGSDQVA